MPANRRDPRTPAEWQEAVDAAEFMLALDSCRQYGLITGGPEANMRRCHSLLRRGRKRGIRPLPFADLAKIYIGTATEDGSAEE